MLYVTNAIERDLKRIHIIKEPFNRFGRSLCGAMPKGGWKHVENMDMKLCGICETSMKSNNKEGGVTKWIN